MASFIGTRIKRKEDPRLLVGLEAFTEDIQLAGTLWAYFARSPHAHARIRNIDPTAALAHPRVVSVLIGRDIYPRDHTCSLIAIPSLPALETFRSQRPSYYLMAVDKVLALEPGRP